MYDARMRATSHGVRLAVLAPEQAALGQRSDL